MRFDATREEIFHNGEFRGHFQDGLGALAASLCYFAMLFNVCCIVVFAISVRPAARSRPRAFLYFGSAQYFG